MRRLRWTLRARTDLRAIRAFVAQDSPRMAEVVVSRIFAAAERLLELPQSGRSVPEFSRPDVREIIHRPYRIVYRVVDAEHIDILTVHHAARRFPDSL